MRSLYRTRRVDFRHEDGRGCLVQLIHDGFAQVNVLSSKAGATRGAHFHKISTEAFYVVSGSVQVTLCGGGIREEVVFRTGDFFEIAPLVLHNMYFDEDCLMIQMYDTPVEKADGSKDIFTEEEFHA